MNCRNCHEPMTDEKRHWKKFCSNKCKQSFDEFGPNPVPKKEKNEDDDTTGSDG